MSGLLCIQWFIHTKYVIRGEIIQNTIKFMTTRQEMENYNQGNDFGEWTLGYPTGNTRVSVWGLRFSVPPQRISLGTWHLSTFIDGSPKGWRSRMRSRGGSARPLKYNKNSMRWMAWVIIKKWWLNLVKHIIHRENLGHRICYVEECW